MLTGERRDHPTATRPKDVVQLHFTTGLPPLRRDTTDAHSVVLVMGGRMETQHDAG